MGTWGIGTFDDDTASDWLDEFLDAPSVETLRRTLAAPDDGYLEFTEAIGFLAAAEIVAGVLTGPREGLPDEALTAIASFTPEDVLGLRSLAAQRARRVLAEKCELQELWSENETDYPAWRSRVLDLCARLEG
jgi:uncharacterized protein DUF4259